MPGSALAVKNKSFHNHTLALLSSQQCRQSWAHVKRIYSCLQGEKNPPFSRSEVFFLSVTLPLTCATLVHDRMTR